MVDLLVQRPGIVYNLLEELNFPYCGSGEEHRQPDIDIRERGDHFILEADIPGVSEKDIDIEIDNSKLTIKANFEEAKENKEEKYLLHERRQVHFLRSFSLSKSVDTEKVEASFKNGILTIVVPKKAQEKSKKITVIAQ